MKFGRNVLHVNMHRLTESDFYLTPQFQFRWRRGVVVSGVGLINEVNRH